MKQCLQDTAQGVENNNAQYVFERLPRGKAGEIENPSWEQIKTQILLLSRKPRGFWKNNWGEGTLILRFKSAQYPAHFETDCVCVHASKGNYLLIYTKTDVDGNHEIYELFDFPERAGQEMIWAGVEHFDPSKVGQDISVVVKAFKKFFDTGELNPSVYGL